MQCDMSNLKFVNGNKQALVFVVPFA
jgi:hypothetical protein